MKQSNNLNNANGRKCYSIESRTIKKTLLIMCLSMLFCGCYHIKDIKIAGTTWKSTTACTPNNEFIYIHFIDKTTFEYCLVDYDLNKLRDVEESSYVRISDSDIEFSANGISLRSANFGGSGITMFAIIPISTLTKKSMNLILDNGNIVACKKITKKVKN